ncbi:MAG: hypothetical protein WCW27_03615 [Patescibacteria group bacterium]|jgi:hypothetical protein
MATRIHVDAERDAEGTKVVYVPWYLVNQSTPFIIEKKKGYWAPAIAAGITAGISALLIVALIFWI